MTSEPVRSQREAIAIAIVVALPALLSAMALLPELTVPVPSNNDDATHFLLIKRASEVIAGGGNPLDFWVSNLELGMPWFEYYQPLPALAVAVLHRFFFGAIDVLTLFNAARYLLLVLFPATVFWSMRRMGASLPAAGVAAAAATLISGNFRYGFEYESYTWRGFGMFTQLCAMHLSFIAIALLDRALRTGRGMVVAAIVLALLAMTHLIYIYMMVFTAVLLTVRAVRSRRQFIVPFVRLAAMGAPALALSAWLWLPFLTTKAFLGISPYLQREKYDSYGAPTVLGWLAGGDLLDHDRLPVLTLFLAIGLVAAAVTRSALARTVVGGLILWLVLYSGRPTLGGLVDLLPLHEGLLMHRFIGSVDIFALMLIGLGGGWLWDLVHRSSHAQRLVLAAPLMLILLTPAIFERASFHGLSASWMRTTLDAIHADADAAQVIAYLHEHAEGRVFAGLRSGWGKTMDFSIPFNSVRFSDVLMFEGFDLVAAPNSSLTLNADLVWDLDDARADQRELLDVRYEVRPAGLAAPAFLQRVFSTAKYVVYRAPSPSNAVYASFARTFAVTTQTALFALNRPWFNGGLPGQRIFNRYDYPARFDGAGEVVQGCADGQITFEKQQPGRIEVVATCATGGTLVFKTSYHPGWQVTVDDRRADSYMTSPSFIGVDVAPGRHRVVAEYHASPLKVPLALVAAILGGVLWRFRERIDEELNRVLLFHVV